MAIIFAVALLSAAVLGFEIVLVRMFSIAQWHHFASMIISLALLGYGAGGAFLALFRERLVASFPLSFAGFAGLFGIAAPVSLGLAKAIPLNLLEMLWEPARMLNLAAVYVVLAVPFFGAGVAIGLALSRPRARIGAVYRADLVGAGIGALGMVGVLFVLEPADALRLVGALGLGAGALAVWDGSRRAAAGLAVAAAALGVLWPAAWATPVPSQYKGLSRALLVPGAEVVARHSSPLGLLSVVRSPQVPFRHAPGLSLMTAAEPPRQLAVFTDGGAMTAIDRFDGRLEPLAYLDGLTAALPYHLLERPRVLVLGAGGGADVLLARFHRAASVDAVEMNPDMAALTRALYDRPEIRLHVAEARSFAAVTERRFDLIHISLLDSFDTAAAGLHSLGESPLYTVEAFETYLSRLAPGGLLAITRWLKVPPRDSLRLFATASRVLGRDAGRRLALIRGWRTTTLVVGNRDFTDTDLAAIRDFCRRRGFDVAYLPGMAAGEANRFNRLDRPYLFEGATKLLGPGREAFLEAYKFDLTPPTDDRPYFFHFLKWRSMIELLRLGPARGMALVEWGSIVLIATVVQAAVLGALLIVLPLAALRRGGTGKVRLSIYFLALGLAFLFVEIAFIQRFVLFLGHPLYAIAVVIAGFLVAAGFGAGQAARLRRRLGGRPGTAILVAAAGIAVLAALYLVGLGPLFEALRGLPGAAKVVVSLALIAPLAFLMGMPFPLGLARTAERTPELVPWAWGINGCASVLGAVLANLLAVHLGFAVVVGLALALYGTAALAFAERR